MKQLFAILLTLLVSVSAQGAHAYNVNQHNRLDRLTTGELMLRGQDFLQNKGWADSAMVCYSIVADRAQHNGLDSKSESLWEREAVNGNVQAIRLWQ